MSEPDLASHISVRFEFGTRQAVAETEAGIISRSMSGILVAVLQSCNGWMMVKMKMKMKIIWVLV